MKKLESPEYRAEFEIIGTNLHDAGVRLLLTSRMIRNGIRWGSIENIGSKKISIRLGAKSKDEMQKHYITIKKNFIKWLDEDMEEAQRVSKKIANPTVRFTRLVYDKELYILPINLHSHAILTQQLRKGVGVFGGISSAIKELSLVNQGILEILKSRV